MLVTPNAPGGLGTAISETGVIQLLFDTHLLANALSNATVPGSAAPPAGGATASIARTADATRTAQRELEQQLVGRLDPIDWLSYEKYLKGLVLDCLARKSLLVGLLVATTSSQEVCVVLRFPHLSSGSVYSNRSTAAHVDVGLVLCGVLVSLLCCACVDDALAMRKQNACVAKCWSACVSLTGWCLHRFCMGCAPQLLHMLRLIDRAPNLLG